jgi:sortase A
LLVHGAWIPVKARLAQVLLERAWARARAGEASPKPWPWADTHPVARLSAPGHDVRLIVLAGSDGRAMAFGPGWMLGSAQPGEAGNTIIGGHRDTHFEFLEQLAIGDELVLETPGRVARYRVARMAVADQDDARFLLRSDDERLTLITCWPFHALVAGGRDRYVVIAAPA